MNKIEDYKQFENLDPEQLPVDKHQLHDWTHFVGYYSHYGIDKKETRSWSLMHRETSFTKQQKLLPLTGLHF